MIWIVAAFIAANGHVAMKIEKPSNYKTVAECQANINQTSLSPELVFLSEDGKQIPMVIWYCSSSPPIQHKMK